MLMLMLMLMMLVLSPGKIPNLRAVLQAHILDQAFGWWDSKAEVGKLGFVQLTPSWLEDGKQETQG